MTTTIPAIEFVFALPSRLLSPNGSQRNWHARREAKAAYRYACYIEALQVRRRLEAQGVTFPLPVPVTAHTTFSYKVARARDEDNLGAMLKGLWDGLRDAKVLAADDSASLHHAPLTVVVVPAARACVRVLLEVGA